MAPFLCKGSFSPKELLPANLPWELGIAFTSCIASFGRWGVGFLSSKFLSLCFPLLLLSAGCDDDDATAIGLLLLLPPTPSFAPSPSLAATLSEIGTAPVDLRVRCVSFLFLAICDVDCLSSDTLRPLTRPALLAAFISLAVGAVVVGVLRLGVLDDEEEETGGSGVCTCLGVFCWLRSAGSCEFLRMLFFFDTFGCLCL
mmetsp:Transcript_21532/g.34736  ORF Transcript_21532/g.34736 Transcript_21532/m.34736 type:complete len:200 (+) Transcript_21532:429-1028(+)